MQRMSMLKGAMVALAMALVTGVMLAGCSTVLGGLKTTAKAAYGVASTAVGDYCALPLPARAAGQLVLVGKVYNSGLCDVVTGDVDLQAQLANATAQQVNLLIAAKVDAALANGTITQAQADLIRGTDPASSTAAVEAVVVTAGAKDGETAAVVTDTETAEQTKPVATPTPEPPAARPEPDAAVETLAA